MGNEDLYLRAVEELERGLSPVQWRRLKEAAGWDEHGARALYVKIRVQELRREREESLVSEHEGLMSLHGAQRRARIAELLGEMADVLKQMEDLRRGVRSSWGSGGVLLVLLGVTGLYLGGGAQIGFDAMVLVGVAFAGIGYLVASVLGGWFFAISPRRGALADRLTELDRTVHRLQNTPAH